MNMKCPNCSYKNLPNSIFCQECGTSIEKQPYKEVNSQEKSFRHEIEKIEDIIFTPKKKTHTIRNLLLIISFFVIIIIFAVISENNTNNNSTSTDNATDSQIDLTSFPISKLQIEELNSEWVGQQLYIKGILKNSYSLPAGNIKVRVDFYKDKNNQQLFDTRYMTMIGVSANGAFRFNEPIYINPYYEQFWYFAQIESAEFLK